MWICLRYGHTYPFSISLAHSRPIAHLNLNKLVVVGDQSSGKSSLLESLTGIPFPRDVELCTRYATQITQRRDDVSRVEVRILPGPNASDAHKKHVEGYQVEGLTPSDFRDKFPAILKKVCTTYSWLCVFGDLAGEY